jgi:hypothetical protein
MLVDRHAIGAERPHRPFRPALPHVLLIGVLFVGASVVMGEAASRLMGPRTPAMVARAILLASAAATAIAQTFLVYAPLVLRLRGGNAVGALRASAVYARRYFLATAFLIMTVLLAHMPLDLLLARADRIAARFHPEAVLLVMFASVALEMFTAYLLFAGVTQLALPREGGLR